MSRVLPILFNTDMVRAILDGRKTVTRRICKGGDIFAVPDMSFYNADKRTYAVHSYADKEYTDKLGIAERPCPICPGDILYVRETWANLNTLSCPCYYYKASDNLPEWALGGWKPSIHMPKKAARIWLKVTDVRVERLQEITVKQTVKEGCADLWKDEARLMLLKDVAKDKNEFTDLWDLTVKKSDTDKYGWAANPWVWVIEFERCEKPESEE